MPMPKSVLWEINADQHHTSYLLGTIHIEDIGLASFKLAIEKYLSQADIIGTEIHLLDAKQFNLQDYILIDPLSDQYISDIHWEKLEQRCLRYLGLDISGYKQYKPLVILNIISIHILANNASHQGLDEWIWEQGERNHKICIGLEDLVTHYNYLNQIPLPIQYKMLLDASKNITKLKKQSKQLLASYLKQDLTTIYKKSKKMLGQYRHSFLYERNHSITEQIIHWSKTGSLFASCGAGHLGGHYGIISLLKRSGFKIKPIQIN